jgi:hypothetical protein
MTMFRFGKDPRHPLSDPKAVARWFDSLPKTDLFAFQAAILDGLSLLAAGTVKPTAAAAEALIAVDVMSDRLRRALLAQYLEVANRPGTVERRVWQTAFDLAQGFLQCYQIFTGELDDSSPARRAKGLATLLVLHHVYQLGQDSLLRLFRFEQWIPGKWQQLHRLYASARADGVHRQMLALTPAAQSSIEREYLKTVLVQLFNAGNLTQAQVALLAGKFDEWVGLVRVVDDAGHGAPYVIDLQGAAGARRLRHGQPPPGSPLYLDTSPLEADLLQAQAVIRQKLANEPLSERAPRRTSQLGMLIKLSRQLDPESSPLVRRSSRRAASGEAQAVVGFQRVSTVLREEDVRAASGLHSVLETSPDPAARRGRTPGSGASIGQARRTPYGSAVEFWELRDASAHGVRMLAPATEGTVYAIGMLAALRLEERPGWILATIRRIRRVAGDRIELGLQLLSESVLGVELLVNQRMDASYSVDGESVTLATSRYLGLYLPRPGASESEIAHSIVVPTNAYDTKLEYIVTSSRASYRARLGAVIERQSDCVWSWLELLAPVASDLAPSAA